MTISRVIVLIITVMILTMIVMIYGITHFLQRKRKTIRTHSSLARTTDTHYVFGCARI